jgi:hypothetical protein
MTLPSLGWAKPWWSVVTNVGQPRMSKLHRRRRNTTPSTVDQYHPKRFFAPTIATSKQAVARIIKRRVCL